MKLCNDHQLKRWLQINEEYMTEESDNEEGGFSTHRPWWRSHSNRKHCVCAVVKLLECFIAMVMFASLRMHSHLSFRVKQNWNWTRKKSVISSENSGWNLCGLRAPLLKVLPRGLFHLNLLRYVKCSVMQNFAYSAFSLLCTVISMFIFVVIITEQINFYTSA